MISKKLNRVVRLSFADLQRNKSVYDWQLKLTRRYVSSFDTYKFIQRLEQDGFSRDKSEAIMNSLSDLVSESAENLLQQSVKKADFEKTLYQSQVDLAHLRSEVSLMEKNEFLLLKAEIGRLRNESEKIPIRIAEEFRRVQSNVRVELSIDKARIREDQAQQELKIKDAMSKIDTEVGNFRTGLETIQWELFRTLVPLFLALSLGVIRFYA